MSQKIKILELLNDKQMTQGELSIAIYGDNKHMPNIYSALMSLVDSGVVIRTGSHPSIYSLSGVEVQILSKSLKRKQITTCIETEITNELIEEAHQRVKQTENYGKEDDLITDCFKRFPHNDDVTIVAMKVGLIDITNSTHVSQHKSLISAVELAEAIVAIENIDERIKNGDPEVVNEIARSNGKINLFSFASKYCCYHNKNLYGKDDYSILDTVLKESLPKYFNDVTKSQIQRWQDFFQYKEYNDYITRKLDELGITIEYRKRKFDHFVWFNNR